MGWKDKYKDKIVSVEDAVKLVKSGDKVMIQETHSEPKILLKALIDRAPELRDVTVMAHLHWGPADYSKPEYQGSFKGWSQFLGNNTRNDFREGRVDFLPMYFIDLVDYYSHTNPPDVFILQVPTPNDDGICSFGLNADYAVTAAASAKKLIVQVNPSLPYTYGETISLDRATCIVEQDEPLTEIAMGKIGETELMIGKHIADIISDGDTLQLGIGGVPDAVLSCLSDKKDLGIHTEMFSDGVVDLYNAGVITNKRKNVNKGKFICNFLVGTKKLFDFVDHNPDVLVLSVEKTNDPRVASQNDNLVSINSCFQVDLFGQVVSASLNGVQYSGVGGQVDFVRASNWSKGGKAIITLKSTAKKGTISNVVCHLPKGSIVTTSRYDVGYICSEYGLVNLHGLTVRERAKALIGIAHPDYREELSRQAKELKII